MIILTLILILALYMWFKRKNILSIFHAAASLSGNPVLAAVFERQRLDQEQCEVEIIGADLEKGFKYDMFSKPDPFVIVKHHLSERRTETERNTYHPRFLFKSRMPLFINHKKRGFLFEMLEDDMMGEDKVIGRAYLKPDIVREMIDSRKPRMVSLGEGIGLLKVKVTRMDDKYKEKKQKGGALKLFSRSKVTKLDEISDDSSSSASEGGTDIDQQQQQQQQMGVSAAPAAKKTKKPKKEKNKKEPKKEKKERNFFKKRQVKSRGKQKRPSWSCRSSTDDVIGGPQSYVPSNSDFSVSTYSQSLLQDSTLPGSITSPSMQESALPGSINSQSVQEYQLPAALTNNAQSLMKGSIGPKRMKEKKLKEKKTL